MRLKDLHPSKRLDLVLEKIRGLKNPNHWMKYDELLDEIITSNGDELYDNRWQLTRILQKLIKDKYITDMYKEHNNIPMWIYILTFEGEALLDLDGGYSGMLEKKTASEMKEDENRKQLFVLTVLASVGTGGSLIIQTLDFFDTTKNNAIFFLSPLWVLSAFFLGRYLLQKLDQ